MSWHQPARAAINRVAHSETLTRALLLQTLLSPRDERFARAGNKSRR
jgi:hypothetical protein